MTLAICPPPHRLLVCHHAWPLAHLHNRPMVCGGFAYCEASPVHWWGRRGPPALRGSEFRTAQFWLVSGEGQGRNIEPSSYSGQAAGSLGGRAESATARACGARKSLALRTVQQTRAVSLSFSLSFSQCSLFDPRPRCAIVQSTGPVPTEGVFVAEDMVGDAGRSPRAHSCR